MWIIVRRTARPPRSESAAVDRNLQIELIQELRRGSCLYRFLALFIGWCNKEFHRFRFCINDQYMRNHGTRDPLNHAAITHAFVQFLFDGNWRRPAAAREEITSNTQADCDQ